MADKKEYSIHVFKTGCMSGTLDPKKLEEVLNEFASRGWALNKTIHEEQKVAIFFKREAHFLIFEK